MVEKASPFLALTFLEGTLDIARRSLAGHIFALIIILFTLAEPYLNLDPPFFKIGGNRRKAESARSPVASSIHKGG